MADIDLVGRDRPIADLRAALERANDGRGRFVAIVGEPGIGKSAIASVLTRDAQALGASVVFGRAWELGEAPPYFPLRPCLASLGITMPEGANTDAFQLWERVLAALGSRADSLPVWIIEDIHAADLGS